MDEKVEMKKEKKKGKVARNLTVLVVVLCISAAVYLNYMHNNPRNADSVLSNTLAESKNNEEMAAVAEDYVSEYFAQARLTRQESRDKSLALLQVAATADSATQETINGAMDAIAAMATYSMQETQIENLILSKGFADCVVFMSEKGIRVAVPAADTGLTADEVARITEAIITETTYNATQITVIPVVKHTAESATPVPEQSAPEGGTDAESWSMDDLAAQGGYEEDGVIIFE